MDRLITLGQLLDWYGTFLTERQRSLVRQYAYEDCSLTEIAERESVSRQAVRDAISRAERELSNMEQKLHLIQKHTDMQKLLTQMQEMTDDPALRDKIMELTTILEDDDGV
ncbi:MAG: sigma factor-like helix-turn-helix DNA-binding protein [Clostridia bacterium]